ncbi:MAG: hypothetical protein KDA53_16355 [Hyphomonas sp.]|nr:hypothetical protein [Hyphomonas sp.]
MQFRPFPVMTVLSLISLGILIWLGNWQYGRFQQKMAIDQLEPEWVVLDGEIVPGSEVRAYFYADGQAGWMRVVAVDTGTGLVFTPIEIAEQVEVPPPCTAETCASGRLSAEGLYKPPYKRNAFTAPDDAEARVFYVLDPSVFAALLPEAVRADVAADVFEPAAIRIIGADGVARVDTNPYARLRLDDELPPQRHFGYAITWWGLAMALIGVYLAFHYQKGRLRFRKERGS